MWDSSIVTRSTPTPVVIFGAGGLAREVAWAVSTPGAELHWQDGHRSSPDLVGYLDDRSESYGTDINGRRVRGGAEWIADQPGHAVIVAVGNSGVRKQIVQRLRDMGVTFPSVLAVDTVFGDEVVIGEGVIAFPGVVVTTNVCIGDFVLLNPHVSISHDGVIGSYCSLGPGVTLAGDVHVGEGSDLGTNASAIPGVRIGSNVVLGAGACVVRDLPDNVTAVGVPARVVESSYQEKVQGTHGQNS